MVDDHVVDCFRYREAHLDNRMKFAVTHSQSPRCSGFPVASRNPTSTSVGTLIGLVVDQCLRGLNSRPDGIRRRDIGYDQKNIASSYSFNHARLKPGRNKCSTISKNQALKSTNRSFAVERKWCWTCRGGASWIVGYAPVPSWWISAPTGCICYMTGWPAFWLLTKTPVRWRSPGLPFTFHAHVEGGFRVLRKFCSGSHLPLVGARPRTLQATRQNRFPRV